MSGTFSSGSVPNDDQEFDVVLSFASEDQDVALEFKRLVEEHGYRVGCYSSSDQRTEAWGNHLNRLTYERYGRRAAFCVVFYSKAYADKIWTKLEFQVSKTRASIENRDYLLLVKLDDTAIPELAADYVYMDPREVPIPDLVKSLCEKLARLSRLGRAAWSGVAAILNQRLLGEAQTIADMRGYLKGIDKSNPEAGVDAVSHGLSADDAAILAQAENLYTFIGLLDRFCKAWIDRIRLFKQPRHEEVLDAFHKTIHHEWMNYSGSRWRLAGLLLVIAMLLVVAVLVGFVAAVMFLGRS